MKQLENAIGVAKTGKASNKHALGAVSKRLKKD